MDLKMSRHASITVYANAIQGKGSARAKPPNSQKSRKWGVQKWWEVKVQLSYYP